VTFTDEELFADLPGQPSAAAAKAKGAAALGVLLSAGLQPPFGFDQPNAEHVWGVQLADLPATGIVLAAEAFIAQPNVRELPPVGEFTAYARRHVQALRATERNRPQLPPIAACPNCDPVCPTCDTNGWYYPEGPDGGVAPCPTCRPNAAALYPEHGGKRHRDRGGCQACRDSFGWSRDRSDPGPRRARPRRDRAATRVAAAAAAEEGRRDLN